MKQRTLAAWAATLLLLVLCLVPKGVVPGGEVSPRRIPHLDKVAHFSMFAGFALLWFRAGGASTRVRATRVLGAAFALAVATELLQGLPAVSRDPDVLDALADAVGAVVGVAGSAWRESARAGAGPDG